MSNVSSLAARFEQNSGKNSAVGETRGKSWGKTGVKSSPRAPPRSVPKAPPKAPPRTFKTKPWSNSNVSDISTVSTVSTVSTTQGLPRVKEDNNNKSKKSWNIKFGGTSKTTTTTTTTATKKKWSVNNNKNSEIKGLNNEMLNLADKNEFQMSHCKFLLFFIFWILILWQGIIGLLKSESMLLVLNYYSNENENCSNYLKDDKNYGEYSNMTLYELGELGYNQAFGWIICSIFFLLITLLSYIFLSSNLYILERKYYVYINYLFAHLLSCPFLFIFVALWQILNLSYFGGFELQNEIWFNGSLEDYIQDYCEDDAFDTIEKESDEFANVTYISLIILFFYGALIPIIVSCIYCVRGKYVFKDYKENGMDCLIYCKCCLTCSRGCCTCPCCESCCCMKE